MYVMEEAVRKDNVQVVESLMDLGAMAECPHPKRSYLLQASTPDMQLLLLRKGADPNKQIKLKHPHKQVKQIGPAFLSLFTFSKGMKVGCHPTLLTNLLRIILGGD